MKLYEFGPTRSIRVRWTLQELGVDFESVTVNMLRGENRSPGFLAVNPAGKLPVLVDGDLVLTESVAIVLYLAEKYPEKRFLPADLKLRAQHDRWLLFVTTELDRHMRDREFVAGDHVTVADFVAGYTLDWGNSSELLAELPALQAYMTRLYERPKAPLRIAEAFARIQR